MKHVSNEQKAKEIAKSNGINYKNHSKYEDDMDSTLECYKSALEAMQWKDEEYAKEKESFFKEYRKEILDACIYDFEQKKTTTLRQGNESDM